MRDILEVIQLKFSDITRKQAFLSHLSVSMIIFLLLSYLILFQWYPSFYFDLDGGLRGITTIFIVDVVLGPGLTLLVFKQGKKGLKFDMTIVLLFQLVALSWGIKSVYEDRSAVTVFYDGRFLSMSHSVATEVDVEKISRGKSGNQKLAYLDSPKSFEQKSEFMREAYSHGTSAEYYYGARFEPVGENNVTEILEYQFNLDELMKENPANADVVNKYIETHPGYQDKYTFYPVNSRFSGGLAVFDHNQLKFIDVLAIRTALFAEKIERFIYRE